MQCRRFAIERLEKRELLASNPSFELPFGEHAVDQVGVFRTSPWPPSFVLDTGERGYYGSAGEVPMQFGLGTAKAIAGDWDGDGIDNIGVYQMDPGSGSMVFVLDVGQLGVFDSADRVLPVPYGLPTDLPIAGNWNGGPAGDKKDDVGLYRDGVFHLSMVRDATTTLTSDRDIVFGIIGDQPIAGDWDGDGSDDVGVFQQNPISGQTIFVLNMRDKYDANDAVIEFGLPGDRGLAGDWDGDGIDEVGVFRPSEAQFYLDLGCPGFQGLTASDLQQHPGCQLPDQRFQFGLPGDQVITGNWGSFMASDSRFVQMDLPGWRVVLDTYYGAIPTHVYGNEITELCLPGQLEQCESTSPTTELLDQRPGAAFNFTWDYGQDPTQASANGPTPFPIARSENSASVLTNNYYAREVDPNDNVDQLQLKAGEVAYAIEAFAPAFWLSFEPHDDFVIGRDSSKDDDVGRFRGWRTFYSSSDLDDATRNAIFNGPEGVPGTGAPLLFGRDPLVDEVGIFRTNPWPPTFVLDRDERGDFAHASQTPIHFGLGDAKALAGDWDGDGIDNIGVYQWDPGRNSMIFALDIPESEGSADAFWVREVPHGLPTDIPIAGNWNGGPGGDLRDDVGLYREGRFMLSNVTEGDQLVIDEQFSFGLDVDQPIAGDWDGDGTDDVGVLHVRDSGESVFVLNLGDKSVFNGDDLIVPFGEPGDQGIAGDWDGDGVDEVGVFRASTAHVELDLGCPGFQGFTAEDLGQNTDCMVPDQRYEFGSPGDQLIAGNWATPRIRSGAMFMGNQEESVDVSRAVNGAVKTERWSTGLAEIPDGRLAARVRVSLADANDPGAFAGLLFRTSVENPEAMTEPDAVLAAPGYLLSVRKDGVVQVQQKLPGQEASIVWNAEGYKAAEWEQAVNSAEGILLEIRMSNSKPQDVQIWINGMFVAADTQNEIHQYAPLQFVQLSSTQQATFTDLMTTRGKHFGLYAYTEAGDVKFADREVFDVGTVLRTTLVGRQDGFLEVDVRITNPYSPVSLYATQMPAVFVNTELDRFRLYYEQFSPEGEGRGFDPDPLFSLSDELVDELDLGQIPAKLADVLRQHNRELSPDADASVITVGSQWRVDDGAKEIRIFRDWASNQLDVYGPSYIFDMHPWIGPVGASWLGNSIGTAGFLGVPVELRLVKNAGSGPDDEHDFTTGNDFVTGQLGRDPPGGPSGNATIVFNALPSSGTEGWSPLFSSGVNEVQLVSLWSNVARDFTSRLSRQTASAQRVYRRLHAEFRVNSTDDVDDGVCDEIHCSLREAIHAANATSARDVIAFDIDSGGTQTIQPRSPLPTITGPVILDATTQPGYVDHPLIVLNGALAGASANGLKISAGDSTIRGFVINGFAGQGLKIEEQGGNRIQGNYIGTDVTGMASIPNAGGMEISSADNVIGGITDGAKNVISGNGDPVLKSGNGIGLIGPDASWNQIIGNYVGVDETGVAGLGNGRHGIWLWGALSNYIGGIQNGAGNVISANGKNGIWISTQAALGNVSSGNFVQGNLIGTDASGTVDLGNGETGVAVTGTWNWIGGSLPVLRNVISGNQLRGVEIQGSESTNNLIMWNRIGTDRLGMPGLGNAREGVRIANGASENTLFVNTISSNGSGGIVVFGDGTSHNSIAANTISWNLGDGVAMVGDDVIGNEVRSNAIFGNQGLEIDLADDGVTDNDIAGQDADAGPNGRQNFPELLLAVAEQDRIVGQLQSAPNTTYDLDFFASDALHPSGHGQARRFVGGTIVATDAAGYALFDASHTDPLKPGEFVTATATDPAGNTSELALSIEVAPPPAVVDILAHGHAWGQTLEPTSLIDGSGLSRPLPFLNLDQIDVVFDRQVDVSRESLTVVGVNNSQYVPADFTYNPESSVATWSFPSPLPADKFLLNLAGEPTDAQPIAEIHNWGRVLLGGGTDFEVRFDVLPGDVNGDGAASVTDLANVADRVGGSIGPPAVGGYAAEFDINADGTISVTDLANAAVRVVTTLPTGDPSLPAPLMAAAKPLLEQARGELLGRVDLDRTVAAAIDRFADAGYSAAELGLLSKISFQIVDLPGRWLGAASGKTIEIDANAAGHGWYVDLTPWDDMEFHPTAWPHQLQADSERQLSNRMDLLTVVMHELGHVLGQEHRPEDELDLMAASLLPGVRRTPDAVDAWFALP